MPRREITVVEEAAESDGCGFCGRSREGAPHLVAAETVAICHDCTESALEDPLLATRVVDSGETCDFCDDKDVMVGAFYLAREGDARICADCVNTAAELLSCTERAQLKRPARCHYCFHGEDEVSQLAAGPGVNICDACAQWLSRSTVQSRQDEDERRRCPFCRTTFPAAELCFGEPPRETPICSGCLKRSVDQLGQQLE